MLPLLVGGIIGATCPLLPGPVQPICAVVSSVVRSSTLGRPPPASSQDSAPIPYPEPDGG